jgi:hypothetical protein
MPVPIPQASVFTAFGMPAYFEEICGPAIQPAPSFRASESTCAFDRAKILNAMSMRANERIVTTESVCKILPPGSAFYDGGQGRMHRHLHLARRRGQPPLIGAGGIVVVFTTGKEGAHRLAGRCLFRVRPRCSLVRRAEIVPRFNSVCAGGRGACRGGCRARHRSAGKIGSIHRIRNRDPNAQHVLRMPASHPRFPFQNRASVRYPKP